MTSRTALILVDLQEFALANARTQPAPQLLSTVERLLRVARAQGLVIAHAHSTGTPPGRTGYAETGRDWPEDITGVAPAAATHDGEIVVRRAAWSAFAGTGLETALRERDITEVVVAGLATPYGVESTARDAYDAGFSVLVAVDAVAAPDAAAHEWTLSRVVPLLGRTTSVDEIAAAAREV